jgi:stage III sporulation protein AA
MNKMLDVIFESSVYAHSDELRQGFLTLPGGHRVGFAGHVVTEGGQIRTMKYISALNVRLAKPVLGCGENVLPHLYSGGRLCSTLLVSPPQAGKTTLLRDLARLVSEKGLRTVVVDERGELAGCYHGIPQLDVGPRTDVLDACPKVDGVIMALRALSPQLIVTDEVGREADAIALQEAANAGVAVFASAHGRSIPELHRRPGLAMMLKAGSFERIIVLSSRLGPGTIEEIKTIPSPSN